MNPIDTLIQKAVKLTIQEAVQEASQEVKKIQAIKITWEGGTLNLELTEPLSMQSTADIVRALYDVLNGKLDLNRFLWGADEFGMEGLST